MSANFDSQDMPSGTPYLLKADPSSPAKQPNSQFSSLATRAIVVGLYGIPCSGKTYLLHQLRQKHEHEPFAFYEGSQVIGSLVPGGLEEFKRLERPAKTQWRELAIANVGKECADQKQTGVVTGHYMFWSEEEDIGESVLTSNDWNTFTHILYLDVPVNVINRRRLEDTTRSRPSSSDAHLLRWQQTEKSQLRDICRQHGILFSLVASGPDMLNAVSKLLNDFRRHTESHNLTCAESVLDKYVSTGNGKMETALVIDGDKTLTTQDTGEVFWSAVTEPQGGVENPCPLKDLFSSTLGYSYTAFRQATLMYEELAETQFERSCDKVASTVTVHPEFVALLRTVTSYQHLGVVVVTCGLGRVWEKIITHCGLSKTVQVIGGGRITDGFVVTAAVKGALVSRLQGVHNLFVWAFGDSPLDLPMLSNANKAVVVVGEQETRSKSMESALKDAIDKDGLKAHQVLLPGSVPPRLDTTRLPQMKLTDPNFLDSLLRSLPRGRVLHATNRNAAKLLMTPMRDVKVASSTLREAHRRTGYYLALSFVAEIIGLEDVRIQHVQGHQVGGFRFHRESQISIVALMRGGEPMAFGVSDAMPLATFLHAKDVGEIAADRLHPEGTIILVDSVINSGRSIMEFVDHIRKYFSDIRIVIVAGVVQQESVSTGNLAGALNDDPNLRLVALRLSDNKFTGKGTTDTGNRLFNTTHVP